MCAVLFIPIAAGPFASGTFVRSFRRGNSLQHPLENSEIVVRQSQLKVVSGVSLILVRAHTRARL